MSITLYLSVTFFQYHQELTINVHNVVHYHTCILSVALYICWWKHQ